MISYVVSYIINIIYVYTNPAQYIPLGPDPTKGGRIAVVRKFWSKKNAHGY